MEAPYFRQETVLKPNKQYRRLAGPERTQAGDVAVLAYEGLFRFGPIVSGCEHSNRQVNECCEAGEFILREIT